MSKNKDDEKVINLNPGQPLTADELEGLSKEQLDEYLGQPVSKGEAVNLIRNLIGIELDGFRKMIGEPLRVLSIQNLALIEMAKDKGLLKDDEELKKYMDKVNQELKDLEGTEGLFEDDASEKEQQARNSEK